MHKSRICVLLAVLCCLTGIPVSVSAAEVESGSVYCFTPADFSDSENFSGICILSLPEAGETKLGSRTLCQGDILTAEGYAVVFVHDTAAELVAALDKIGKVGVRCERGVSRPLPEQQTKRIDTTVSSLRLDCIVSAAVNTSRDRSASLIKSGMVNADFSPCLNVSAEVKENTVISVRGSGRFRLSEISGETRKGRIRVVIDKYL